MSRFLHFDDILSCCQCNIGSKKVTIEREQNSNLFYILCSFQYTQNYSVCPQKHVYFAEFCGLFRFEANSLSFTCYFTCFGAQRGFTYSLFIFTHNVPHYDLPCSNSKLLKFKFSFMKFSGFTKT